MSEGLFIGPLLGPDETGPWTTPAERETAAAFVSEQRRREFLTWRTMVRRRIGAEAAIGYDAVGAPVVTGIPVRIGVSHCRGYAAVCISRDPCAVDIERTDRDFDRAAARYMTSSERRLSDDPLLPAAVWCAKETLYKLAGRRELDLLEDLRIERADLAAGCMWGRIAGGDPVELRIGRGPDYLVVYHL